MGEKIKKFFLSFSRLNKPAVLAAVFFSIFLGLALPLQFVQAQLGLIIGTAVAVTIINLVLQLVLVISNLILGLAGVILSWVLSPYFMSLPYTYGGIVDIGWPIVRDFINMFFIIALVIIGLATALRIKEYQAQKTLPLLIIIAILINFTPVICGVILDASNILMNFFLEELTGFRMLGNMFSAQGTMLLGALQHFYNPLESLALMGKTLVMIIFDWIAAFIFFMFSLLFIMRYVMVWVLVIVSPIAFFSRIFPGSQRYLFKSILGWDEWWKQFIEWSMIGIIGAFFIYLAEQLMVMAPGWIPGIPPGGAWGIITTPLVDFINNLLPWGVMLAFLIIGFFIATSTSAMGANAIINFAKTGGAAATRWAGRRTALWAKERGGPVARRIGERLARFPVAGEKIPGPRGKIIRGVTKPAAWASRAMGGVMIKPFQMGREDIARAEDEANKLRKEDKLIKFKASRSTGERIGILRSIIKNQDIDESMDKDRYPGTYLTKKEVVETMKEAKRFKAHRGLARALPHLAPDMEGATTEEERKKAIDSAVISITHHPEERAENVSIASLDNDDVLNSMAEHLDGRYLGGMARMLGPAAVDRLQKKFDEKELDWFLEEVYDSETKTYKPRNSAIPLYLATNVAQELGFRSFGGMSRDEVRKKIHGAREEGKERKVEKLWVPGMEGVTEEERKRRIREMVPPPAPPAPPPAALPKEEERLIKEWPKAEKEMPKDIKNVVKEGQKYIEALGEKIKSLEVLNKSIEELKRDLTSLKERAVKTPTDEELIRRMEVELLPNREEESRLTQEAIGDIRSRLSNLRERIKPWEEYKGAIERGGKEEERTKEVYRRIKKEVKKTEKKK